MPSLQLTTNVPLVDPKAFIVEFSDISAKTLGKPEQYISCSYTFNEALSFHGTFEPAFLMSVVSLGNINPEANEKYSKAFFEFFERKLGVPGNRGYISFTDPGNANLGHQATTFATIFGTGQ